MNPRDLSHDTALSIRMALRESIREAREGIEFWETRERKYGAQHSDSVRFWRDELEKQQQALAEFEAKLTGQGVER